MHPAGLLLARGVGSREIGRALRKSAARVPARGHPYACHWPSWGCRLDKVCGGTLRRLSETVAHCATEGRVYLLVVAAIAFFVMLYVFDLVVAAIRRPRRCAGRLLRHDMAACVRVVDSGAHAG